ncbi:MAG: nicotinamide mononucleotide transporter [Clostridia bacterium]|nr:nicotinamide mononucleotide transporter [Clostridia bacterium]
MAQTPFDGRDFKVKVDDLPTTRNVGSVGSQSTRQMSGLVVSAKKKRIDTSGQHRSEIISKNIGSGAIKSSSANGRMSLSREAERKIQSESLEYVMRKTGKFEFFWYPTFLILGLLCLILVPIFTKMSTADLVLLVVCVVNLWLCMTANNLVAKGIRVGLLLSVVNMLIYVGISIYQKIWGEVIINVALYIPLSIIGFFNWGKGADESSVNAVNKMNGIQLLKYVTMYIVITVGVWAILNFVLQQSFAIFNAISIAGCIVGDLSRNKRFFEVWYFYMLCNIGGILLWSLQIFAGGGEISLAILPTVISFMATLSNNFNGIYIWNILYKNKHKNGGVYLAKRKVDIRKIVRLKRTYKKMTCKEV